MAGTAASSARRPEKMTATGRKTRLWICSADRPPVDLADDPRVVLVFYSFECTSIFDAMLPALSLRYDTVTTFPFNVASPATLLSAPVTIV